MSTIVIIALAALVVLALIGLVKPEFASRALTARDWLVAQSWFPNRRVLTGAIAFAVAFIVAKAGFDVNDPYVAAGISLVVAKVTEYLLPPSSADVSRAQDSLRRRRLH